MLPVLVLLLWCWCRYCQGQYPPALEKLIAKRKNFAQLEDFNKQKDEEARKYQELCVLRLRGCAVTFHPDSTFCYCPALHVHWSRDCSGRLLCSVVSCGAAVNSNQCPPPHGTSAVNTCAQGDNWFVGLFVCLRLPGTTSAWRATTRCPTMRRRRSRRPTTKTSRRRWTCPV